MRKLFLATWMLLVFAVSCDTSSDEGVSRIGLDMGESDATEDAVSDELDDLVRIALNSDEAVGGRIKSIDDPRLNCAGTSITVSEVSADKSSGRINIVFPAEGCADNFGNVRKGELKVFWSGGKWFQEGSVHSITPVNYFFNDLKIEGPRMNTVTSVSGSLEDFTIEWELEAQHNIRWPDNSTSTRQVNKFRRWHHRANVDDVFSIHNPARGSAIVGTTKRNNQYAVTIEEPLIYNRSCNIANKIFVPVAGVKSIASLSNEPGVIECTDPSLTANPGSFHSLPLFSSLKPPV